MNHLPAWVSKYIGLQYADHGRGPAFDCWGLVRHVLAAEGGIEVPDFGDRYVKSVRDVSVVELIFSVVEDGSLFEPVSQTPRLFDIVVLRIGGSPVHCGLVLSESHFLHIHAGIGSVVDVLKSSRWSSRVEGVFRRR